MIFCTSIQIRYVHIINGGRLRKVGVEGVKVRLVAVAATLRKKTKYGRRADNS